MQLRDPGNAALCRALSNGLGTLHALDDMGLRVRSISAAGRNLVIEIDPPAQPTFLRGVVRRRCSQGRRREVEFVARVRGHEVRWSVCELRDAQAVSA